MKRSILVFFGGAAASLGFASCANLSDVAPSCGNGVVEASEDCDQTDQKTSGDACGAPGTAAACRFICSDTIACPAGFGCGTDGICRAAIPLDFTGAPDVAVEGLATHLITTDWNGDGVDDLLAVTAASVDQHIFNTDRTSTPGTTIRATHSHPSVGVLSRGSDASGSDAGAATFDPSSVALGLSGGVSVFTGGADDLAPHSYASTRSMGAYSAAAYRRLVNNELVTGFVAYNSTGITGVQTKQAPLPSDTFMMDDAPVGEAASGTFLTTSLCSQIALAFDKAGHGHVKVYDPCSMGSFVAADIAFPAGATGPVSVCGAAPAPGTPPGPPPLPCKTLTVTDVDADGYDDLVAVGNDGQLYVAFSDGKAFWPKAQPFSGQQGTFGAFVKLPGATPQPLAIADLNGDCALDVVDAGGIYLSSAGMCAANTISHPAYGMAAAGPNAEHAWSIARVGDVNGDGLPDVIVADAGSTGLNVYRNFPGGHFVPVEIPTFSLVKAAAVGDFDGDGVVDVAYAEQGEATTDGTATHDAVSISFGTRSGPPSDPVSLGDVDGVTQIVPTPDLLASPFVTSINPPMAPTAVTNVYLFVGNTSREIVAPLILLQDLQNTSDLLNYDVPLRSAIGSFRGDPSSGDIVVFAKPVRLCAGGVKCPSRLWLLPTTNDGDIDPASTACTQGAPCASKLPSPLETADDVLLAPFTPPGGSAELVVAAPGAGMVSIATARVSGGALTVGASAPVGFDITVATGKLTEIDADMFTANVDGSGLDLVLASPKGGLMVLPWDATKHTFGSALASTTYEALVGICTSSTSGYGGGPAVGPPMPPVRLGGGMPALPGNKLRAAPWPSQTMVKKLVAQSSAPTSPQQSLVVVTPAGVVLVTYDPSLSSPGKLSLKCLGESQDQGSYALIGGAAIATGDYDGDGVDDIAVSDETGITVYYGNSYAPGKARLSLQPAAGAP
jgi:hypothetical protein